MSAFTDCRGILVAFACSITIFPTRAISKSWRRVFAAIMISGRGSLFFPIWKVYLVVSEFYCTFVLFTTVSIIHHESHQTYLCTHSGGLLQGILAYSWTDPRVYVPRIPGRCRRWLCLAGDGVSGPGGSINHRVSVGNRAAAGAACVLSLGAYLRTGSQ